ncbi:MAG: spore germination protein [Pelosinus sp.]|jgi:spore germination protein KB|nr:spore germination protein [Pelosinus sp.]
MLDQGKISASQLSLLLFTLVGSTAMLFIPAVTAESAGRDGWMSILFLSTIFGLLVAWVCTSLGQHFPRENIIEYSPKVFGPVLGHLISLSYIFFFIWTNAIIVGEFADFMIATFLPETPRLVFVLIIVWLAAYAVRNGLEVIGRLNQFLFPLLLISYLGLVVFVINDIKLANLTPVLENGIKPVLKGSLPPSAWRGEIVLMLMILPNLNQPAKGRKASIYAVVFLGIVLTLNTIATVGVFGAELSSHLTFPYFTLADYGQVAIVLERMEALVMLVWVAGLMIKIAMFYYCGVLALARWFNLQDYKPLITPIGIILIAWSSIIYENSRELVELISKTFPVYAFTFELLIPALLLAVAAVRKKRGGSSQ